MNLVEIKKKYGLTENDFWQTSEGIWVVRHRACLKIAQQEKIKLRPWRYHINNWGERKGCIEIIYKDNLRGIFEIGEVNPRNCTFAYPYLMALKRVQDRVILKLSGLAAQGVYSEVEAEEFKHDVGSELTYKPNILTDEDGNPPFGIDEPEVLGESPPFPGNQLAIYLELIEDLKKDHEVLVEQFIKQEFKKTALSQLTEAQARIVVELLSPAGTDNLSQELKDKGVITNGG